MSEHVKVKIAVFVLLFNEQNELFMLRRYQTGWNDGKWTLPSGHVDVDETITEAALKELLEEAGVEATADDLEFLHVQHSYGTYINFYFKARTWEGEPHNAEPHLCDAVKWFPVEEIPKETIYHVREMLRELARGSQFSDAANDPGDGRHDIP